MYVYIYMCKYMHVYIYLYVHVYMFVYIFFEYVFVYVCVCIYDIYIYIYVYMYTYIYICIYIYQQVSVYGRSSVTIVLRTARRCNRRRVRITLQDKGTSPVNRLVDPIGLGVHLESCGIVACAHTAYLDCVLTVS